MKDFVLSMLSRGYGHVVPDEDGHDGRLEVCFEPEDYFNWKSQPPVLHLTSSGHFFGGLEPVPPKTYSTRRGPLILYSEDLAMPHQSGQVNRKRKTPGCPKQEAEGRLHTLQDLTGAILAFGNKKSKVGSLAAVTHPLLPDTKHTHNIQTRQRAGEKSCDSCQVKGEKARQVRYQPHFLCSPRPNRPTVGPLPPITEGLVHIQTQEKTTAAPAVMIPDNQVTFRTKEQKDQPREKLKERKAFRSVRIEVDTCQAQMSPIPETEQTQTKPADQTEDQTFPSETREITSTTLPHVTDHSKDPNGLGKRIRMESGSGVGEKFALRSVYVDSSLDYSPLSRVNFYGGHMEGSRQTRHYGGETHVRRVKIETDPSFTVFNLPPINQSPLVNSGSDPTLTMNKPEVKDKKRSHENVPHGELHVNLPHIKASGSADGGPSERRVHSKVLLLFPAQTQHTDSPQPDDECHASPFKENDACADVKHEDHKEPNPFAESRCRTIEMDLGPVMGLDNLEKGVFSVPLLGRRGPGKQSSMAVYRQGLCEPADTTDTQTGNTRGCIPLELREWQGGKSVGTLIMGPDGEIIRLSLWDPTADTEDHPIMAKVTQGHVLRVVTSEGDLKQPWTILIQDEDTDEEETTTSDSEETTSDTEQLEVLKINKPTGKTNAKEKQHSLASHSQRVNTHEDTSEDEEEEEDEEEADEEEEDQEGCLHSDKKLVSNAQVFRVKAQRRRNEAEDREEDIGLDSQIIQHEQVFKARSRAKKSKAKRMEECLDADTEIIQEEQVAKVRSRTKQMKTKKKGYSLDTDVELTEEEQVFKVGSRAKQSKTRRKEDCSGADSEVIQEEQVIKARSHAKRSKTKMKEDFYGSDGEILQDAQVCLPEEGSEEMSSSTTHRLNKTTGVQTKRKVKTTALQQETGVTLGSRKSKGAAPAIGPKSTDFSPGAHSPESVSPEGHAEFQTGLPEEAEEGHLRNTDAENRLVEKMKKTRSKLMGKSKGKTVKIQEDAETRNAAVPDDPNSTAKKKKKKTDKQKKEEVDKEKEEPIKAQNSIVKVKKKKKGQPAFVVGKPRSQEAEWRTNPEDEDEPETQMTHKREVTTPDTEDDQFENTQDNSDVDSEDDTDADTDSHEDSPTSVSSAHRSQHSHVTVRSDSSIHRRSHSSIRSGSVGATYSTASLSFIHMPPQSAQTPASDHTKPESKHTKPESSHTKPEPHHSRSQQDNDVKSGAVPTNQADKKAAALSERAELRRLEVEKKRREREEEKKRQQEKEATEERMRLELEEEQRKRAEEARLRKIREEDERRRRQEEEDGRQRREQAGKERERRRQEEKRRLLERLQRERQEEEKRQAAELERQRLEEEARKEEERRKLSEMEEDERLEYLRRQQEEEEERRKAAEERRKKQEEAATLTQQEARLQAELFARQRAALEQHLKFHRGLFVEAEGLEQTQDISRPWLFSYFTLLKMLGLAESTPEDTLRDVL